MYSYIIIYMYKRCPFWSSLESHGLIVITITPYRSKYILSTVVFLSTLLLLSATFPNPEIVDSIVLIDIK
jgi:hypothetical protein